MVNGKRKLAQLSGGTLGYIVGDIGGAVSGYKMAGRAYDFFNKKNKMAYFAPKRRTRVRRHTSGGGITGHSATRHLKLSRVGRRKLFEHKKTKKSKKTLLKNLGNDLMGISQHNDMIMKYGGKVKLGKGHYKLPKLHGKFRYEEGKEFVLAASDGIQSVQVLPAMATRAQLIGTTAANRRGAFEQWEVDPFQLNPYSTIPTNAIYPGPMGAVVAEDRIFLQKCHHKVYLHNMENVPAEVLIYYFTPKVDTTTTPQAEWVAALAAENLTQAAAVNDVALGVNLATGGAATIGKYGQDPLNCRTFKKVWKCVKLHKFVLQGGDRQTYSMDFVWNKVFMKDTLTNRPSGYYANTTVYPILITRGGLVGVATTAAGPPETVTAAATEVTFGPTKVGWITENLWTFGALPLSKLNTQRTYNPALVNADTQVGQGDVIINDVDQMVFTSAE